MIDYKENKDTDEKTTLDFEFDREEIIESEETEEIEEKVDDVYPQLSRRQLEAIEKSPDSRSWKEHEEAVFAKYAIEGWQAQKSFATDDTGKILLDENGEFKETYYSAIGSSRPDLYKNEDGHISLLEAKRYSNANNLLSNMLKQKEKREIEFGDDVDVEFVLRPRFSIDQAYDLADKAEEKGINISFLLK